MVGDDFFDGFVAGGYLPGLQDVTVTRPDGSGGASLEARREQATEEQLVAAGVSAGDTACVWFVPVDQPGYVRPRNSWVVTDAGGEAWYVRHNDLTIQQRGCVLVCTRQQA